MREQARSIEKIVEEQVKKWQAANRQRASARAMAVPLIYVSREPGSRGQQVAKLAAESLKFDFFDRELIMKIADSAHMSRAVVESLDEKSRSVWTEWLTESRRRGRLRFDDYLEHLFRVVGTIAQHGRAVVVGRGAGYIVPEAKAMRVRTIAPREQRVVQWAKDRGISEAEARKGLARFEAEQKAFIKKYFHREVDDPMNYHLIVNTGLLSVEEAAAAVKAAYEALARRKAS